MYFSICRHLWSTKVKRKKHEGPLDKNLKAEVVTDTVRSRKSNGLWTLFPEKCHTMVKSECSREDSLWKGGLGSKQRLGKEEH